MCRLVGSVSHTISSGHPAIVRGFTDIQHWNTRILRRLDAAWDALDPDEVDPAFEEEFAASRARWPQFRAPDIRQELSRLCRRLCSPQHQPEFGVQGGMRP